MPRPTATTAPPAAPRGPKKETARIAIPPSPPARTPQVEMKKTQPLVVMPTTAPPNVPVSVAPEPVEELADEIPMGFCWALLGISAVALIIQIWNYFG